MGATDYTQVTETHGTHITRQALDMMWTRYAFAARFCDGCDVLEVACGAGQGLGVLGARARRVVGGDYTDGLLATARAHYGARIPLVRLDGHQLPFASGSFDLVILYEALYYLADAGAFVGEARRVLRAGGRLIVCTVNRQWSDFNASPLSTTYHSAGELDELLRSGGFRSAVYGAFPVERLSARDQAVSLVKRTAVALNLVPKTMKGKRLLKRVFLGRLVEFPAEVRDGTARYHEPVAVDVRAPVTSYKVLYAVGVA